MRSKFADSKSHRIDWEKLKVFYELVYAGTLEKTHENTGISISTISNYIKALEKDVGAVLINRNKGAQGEILTEAGQTFFKATTDMYKRLEESIAEVENKEQISGTITIATTKGFGISWLFPKLVSFKKIYPDIVYNVSLVDLFQDLIHHNADLYFSPKLGEASSLIHEYLARFEFYAFASKEYLKQYGIPEKIEDLDNHKIISWQLHSFWPQLNWLSTVGIQRGIEREPNFISNDVTLSLQAVENGLGIGLFGQYVELYSTKLVRVLQNYNIGAIDFYVSRKSGTEKINKLNLLLSHLKNE